MAEKKQTVWRCPVCRNEEDSEERPAICHICGVPGERLEKIENESEK